MVAAGPAVDAEEDDTVDDTALDCPSTSFNEVTERWEEIQALFDHSTVTFSDFVAADDFTPVCEIQTIDEIIAALRKDTEVQYSRRAPVILLQNVWVLTLPMILGRRAGR